MKKMRTSSSSSETVKKTAEGKELKEEKKMWKGWTIELKTEQGKVGKQEERERIKKTKQRRKS